MRGRALCRFERRLLRCRRVLRQKARACGSVSSRQLAGKSEPFEQISLFGELYGDRSQFFLTGGRSSEGTSGKDWSQERRLSRRRRLHFQKKGHADNARIFN